MASAGARRGLCMGLSLGPPSPPEEAAVEEAQQGGKGGNGNAQFMGKDGGKGGSVLLKAFQIIVFLQFNSCKLFVG